MKTKDRILDKALELMNKLGLENVSTYNIAKELEIRQSNITYYFPAKNNIVNALAKRMIADVNDAFASIGNEAFTMKSFYTGIDRVMQVHQKYYFFLMNYATLVTADTELNDHFVAVLGTRHAEFEGIISLLDSLGYVNGKDMLPHSYYILLMQNMLTIFWIQESAIYSAGKTDDEKRRHHLTIFFQTFIPYLTPKGEEELLPLLTSAKG
jgi:AcrR family transcriptional regulator